MAASDPIAGPSRSRPSFSIPSHRSSTPNFRKNVYASSRSSTPARARSMSTFSYSAREEDEAIRRERAESVRRMMSSWIGLSDKFGHIGLYEDDEVDLRTGRIVVDRGRVAGMEERKGLGEADSEDEDQSKDGEGEHEAVESDEDELGYWDHRSGLDPQVPSRPLEMPWSERDDEDLREFLRMEERRKELAGEEEQDEDEEDKEDWSSDEDNSDERSSRSSQRSPVEDDDTRSSEGVHSEDELLAFDSEAHRKIPVPSSRSSTPSRSTVSPGVIVNDPLRPVSVSRSISSAIAGPSKSMAVQRSRSAPTLRDLFTPEHVAQRPRSPALDVQTTLDGLFSPSPPTSPATLPARSTNPSASNYISRSKTLNPDIMHRTYNSRLPTTALDRSQSFEAGPSRPSLTKHVVSAGSARIPSRKGKERMTGDNLVSPSFPSSLPNTQTHETLTARTPKPSRKGEERAAPQSSTSHIPSSGSRPEDLDPPSDDERYFQVIHRLNAHTVRYCRTCRASTDSLRVERAYFCKGRTNGQNCVFAKELGEVVVVVRDRNSALKEKRRSMSRALTEQLDNGGREGEEEQVNSVLEAPTPTPKRRGRPRRATAAHMLDPDPEAAETNVSPSARLEELRAKRKMKKASSTTENRPAAPPENSYVLGTEDIPPQTLHEAMLLESAEPNRGRWMSEIVQTRPAEMRGITQSPISPTDTLFHRNQRESTVNTEIGRHRAGSVARSPRVCPICRQAGGERAEQAITCRGRFWTRHCPYSRANSVRPTPTPTPGPPERPADAAQASKSLKRKRPISPASPSPPSEVLDNSTDFESQATRPSLPPSSPPLPSSTIALGQTTYEPATPSPTVSAESVKDISPSEPPAFHEPTSPLARRILPLPKGSHYALRPTPPPSLHRTPSTSSDLIPVSRPRSILRAPSERGSSSAPSSMKRARFSLQPSSPTDFDGGGIFELDNQSIQSSSPWRGDTPDQSSSPFSRELSVRAADVGFKLGPVHTGRISAGLMNALYPKTGSTSSTTATIRTSSSITPQSKSSAKPARGGDTARPYTLPTPPRSTGSSASTPSRSSRTPSKSGAGGSSGAGLMLPPPVPTRRMSGTGSSTPGPVTPTRHSPSTAASPEPPRRVKSSPIKFKVLERPDVARSRSRSRSRFVSLAPASRDFVTPTHKPVDRNAATTPRRRLTRTERELARMARDMPDDAGLEWGLDEDVGQEVARAGREGTMFIYVN